MATPKTTPDLAAQATQDFVTLLFDGDTYTLPTQEEVPLAFLEAYENNELVKAVRLLLGDSQWSKWRGKHEKVGDLRRFLEDAGTRMGGNF